jgi:hypothetical protein
MVAGVWNHTVIDSPGVADTTLNEIYVQVMRTFVLFGCSQKDRNVDIG